MFHFSARIFDWVSVLFVVDHFTLITLLGTPMLIPATLFFFTFVENADKGQIPWWYKGALIFGGVTFSYFLDLNFQRENAEQVILQQTLISLIVGLAIALILSITGYRYRNKLPQDV